MKARLWQAITDCDDYTAQYLPEGRKHLQYWGEMDDCSAHAVSIRGIKADRSTDWIWHRAKYPPHIDDLAHNIGQNLALYWPTIEPRLP